MEEYLKFRADSQPGDINICQYLLDKGKDMVSSPLDGEQKEMAIFLSQLNGNPKAKQCFYNAMFMCMVSHSDSDLISRIKYCEGYVSCKAPFPVHHAWITLDGKIVDVTMTTNNYTLEQMTEFMELGTELPRSEDLSDRILGEIPEGWQYFGVEYDAKEIAKDFIDRKTSFSVIDDWERGWPLLQKNDQTQDQILYK